MKQRTTAMAALLLAVSTALVLLLLLPVSQGLSYADVEATNKSCAPKDTCQQGKADRLGDGRDWKTRNCFCDDQCALYGDCCLDARRFKPQLISRTGFQCVQMRQFGQVYMRAHCPSDWQVTETSTSGSDGDKENERRSRTFQDEDVAAACEAASKNKASKDVVSRLPVTSLTTGITYRSIYCALCNGETSQKDLRFWQPRIECGDVKDINPKDQNAVLERLTYEGDTDTWKLQLNDSSTTCSIDPSMPTTLVDAVRPCLDVVSDCPSDWTDKDVSSTCASYTAVVYYLNERFRNVHCALCHGVESQSLFCTQHAMPRFNIINEFSPVAFSILLDVDFGSDGWTPVGEHRLCEAHELFDPFFKKCRSLVCVREGWVYHQGHCVSLEPPTDAQPIPQDPSTEVTQDPSSNDTDSSWENPKETTGPSDVKLGKNKTVAWEPAFASCPKFLLGVDDYVLESNGTVAYVPKYHKRLPEGDFWVQADGQLAVCAEGSAEEDKFGPVMGYVSLAGLGISIVCLLLHLLVFVAIPELHNLSGKNLASLCVALLAGYVSFSAGQWVKPPGAGCVFLAVAVYYSFLCAFFWMLVMAFDIWRTLRRSSTELRVCGGTQRLRFCAYSLVGWLVPGMVVAAAVVLDNCFAQSVPEHLRPFFGRHRCWFGQRAALLVFFAAPLAFTMLCNLIFFVDSARVLVAASKSPAKPVGCCPARRNFRLYVRMALIMGLAWIAGLVAAALDLPPVWYLFICLNTLQGLFVFVTFTCTRKVAKLLRARFAPKARGGQVSGSSWSASSGSAPVKSSRITNGTSDKPNRGSANSLTIQSSVANSPATSHRLT